jgi:putative nucleotidyltransferase with HDIG domain
VIGSALADLYDYADARDAIRKILDHFEEPHEGEFFLPRADGERLPVIVAARRLDADSPLPDHRLVTMLDIAAQKSAEEALRTQYKIVTDLSNTIMEQALNLREYSQKLEERVSRRTAQLHEANLDALYMLAVASEAKDEDTGQHVRRIQRLAVALAGELGVPRASAEAMGLAAILHDVGKIHVPDQILKKPGPLTAEERAEMQQHTLTGERILSNKPFFATARSIARSHHENFDGSGYPDGGAGEAISLEARIVRVADVFDALTSRRVYKEAWPVDRAAAEIAARRGVAFDPNVADAFARLYANGLCGRNGHGHG